ncbi:MAG: transcriptional regulator [Gammaproteobacteria bacterium 39-13]|nr:ImmA/IrrE family metallo-endopeptidase [Gammaproteobacteria bacterium]OJV92040.1 MAG: transcriptional regulator [Gammaproteobacteria bacterium 39-13]
MFNKRLSQARKASGLSLRKLGDEVGVSHAAIKKYEDGEAKPSSTILLKLAKVLGVRTEYFFRPDIIPDLTSINYRKHSALPKKQLNSISQKIIELIERRIELENLFPQAAKESLLPINKLPKVISNDSDIEKAAEVVRETWKLGIDPILDLIDIFEMQGIRVFSVDIAENVKFDGLCAEVLDKPVIVISNNWPGDRQRFTLAHELGHLLLSEMIVPDFKDEEKVCNHFAGAFLFPRESVLNKLGKSRTSIEIKELSLIKEEFGISMGGILFRALQLDIISHHYWLEIRKLFSKNGWHKAEPGEVYPSEIARVFEQFVFHALAEDCIGESKAAELLSLSLTDFRRLRAMEGKDARTHQ